MDHDWHSLLFGVRRSVRYHERRAAFFSRLDTLNGLISLSAGTSVAATAISGHPVVAFSAGTIVALSNVINVMIGSSRMAALHRELRGRFIGLERQMVLSAMTAENFQRFTDERLRIESEEPPVIGALDALCHNEEARAEGNVSCVRPVSWWQRMGSQFLDYTDKPDLHLP
ncbi:MAG: hypothetical protein M0Z50_00905 [Planctomycetia bacterium]|jgi:hypothetical protein|nr:hypothetical protein [Planctomycetia bacterium]